MSKLPNPEEVLAGIIDPAYQKGQLYKICIRAIQEYGREIRDKTLEWAANNAETYTETFGSPHIAEWTKYVNRKSILDGKTSKDLEI